MKILIIEDEVRLADTLGQIMIEQKYSVDIVNDGQSGYEYALSDQYDVIILDVMLPKKNGLSVVKELRNVHINTPVIMLTAKDETSDKISGLDCGADDYMTKPFVPEELLARIRALSRRQGELIINSLSFGDLKLDLSLNCLECNMKMVHLGYKEFEIMKLMMSKSQIIHSKENLIRSIWGDESDAEDNNVEAYMSFLRKKLFFLESKVNINIIRKVGYRLDYPVEK